ncbi:hypothetical protein C8R44DRAFT_745319 [Mycena epipterygia]|nr:hypothetical protein C8R44DRAFT_745319 [Mycena epipterygia]
MYPTQTLQEKEPECYIIGLKIGINNSCSMVDTRTMGHSHWQYILIDEFHDLALVCSRKFSDPFLDLNTDGRMGGKESMNDSLMGEDCKRQKAEGGTHDLKGASRRGINSSAARVGRGTHFLKRERVAWDQQQHSGRRGVGLTFGNGAMRHGISSSTATERGGERDSHSETGPRDVGSAAAGEERVQRGINSGVAGGQERDLQPKMGPHGVGLAAAQWEGRSGTS